MADLELGEALKLGMRKFASGVCVITAKTDDGKRAAMTASSVTSVSTDPASLLVCINKSAGLDPILNSTSGFAVNVLNANQQEVSNTCASPASGDSRFDVGSWVVDDSNGLSYLNDALAVFFCEKKQTVSYGTHNIYIGDINKVVLGDTDADILVYAKGQYHSI